ncbi:MAG: cysteine desulfuration protein SufE [Rhizobiales bacterium]|nr:cysteine desulfuration protein SufE [Hyphomicrobiales bacterium]
MSIQELIDDFAFLDDWEDRYRYVIELGKTLQPLSDAEHNATNKVEGCVSQVWLITEMEKDESGTRRLTFRGDSDAHIVRGLIAILIALYSGQTPDDILKIDARAVFAEIGLNEHLSPQRSNGLSAMVARVQHDARVLQSPAAS